MARPAGLFRLGGGCRELWWGSDAEAAGTRRMAFPAVCVREVSAAVARSITDPGGIGVSDDRVEARAAAEVGKRLGLITAVHGGLTLADLAELTGNRQS